MRSTLPAVVALMAFALTAIAADDVDQSLIAPSKKAQPVTADSNPFQATASPNKKYVPPRTTMDQSPDELRAHIDSILNNGVISLDFSGQPLNEVMDFFHDKFPELSFQFDNQSLKDAGIDPTTTLVTICLREARLKTALDLLLSQFNLDYYIHDGIPIITPKEKADAIFETRIYDCRDLLISGAENFHKYHGTASAAVPDAKTHSPINDLIQIINNSVRPQSWTSQGGPCTVDEYGGLLVINQTYEGHSQIADLLDKLSAKLAAQEKK
jgi:hypothetical protein